MSTPGHKPASQNPFASYAFQYSDEEIEDVLRQKEEEGETEWSDEDDLYSDDYDEFEDGFEDEDDDDDDFDDDFDDDYDSDTEEDDHEYLEDEEDSNHHYSRNNYAAGPGYFYPEQPYIGLPIVPKPSSEDSKLRYYIFTPICDIAMIYIKFAILAILIYACALWYTVYYGDMSSIITDMDVEDDDADTCPANLST